VRHAVEPWNAAQQVPLRQFAPPQSTSVSPLFFVPSVQLAHVPESQMVLRQSAPVAQGPPSSQGGQSKAVPQPSVV
jgi:hypothetical protein